MIAMPCQNDVWYKVKKRATPGVRHTIWNSKKPNAETSVPSSLSATGITRVAHMPHAAQNPRQQAMYRGLIPTALKYAVMATPPLSTEKYSTTYAILAKNTS
tara:strand:+ start:827 stop:1132 length:306 start_codon:yes stop_codon:yes gene_type:complete